MTYHIHITKTAERDILNATDYIEFVLKMPQASDYLISQIQKQINALSQFPAKHQLAEDKLLASWDIRFIKIGNDLAFYIISEEQKKITIVRFLYSKSNWNSILKNVFSII